MVLQGEIFEGKLAVANAFESGCLVDFIESVKASGSKELLTIFANHDGFDKIMKSERTSDVLDFFIDMATILVNSYDERLGIMSALVYYLCERDRFSIDIVWAWKSVTRFQKFMIWLEPQLNDQRALLLLEYVLNNFPPTRVTPLMLHSIITILPTLMQVLSEEKYVTEEQPSRNNDILLSICYFGAGLEFREYTRTDLLVLDGFYPKLKDARCPDVDCEFLRMARKAIRSRDESPIAENKELAVAILPTMQKGGKLSKALKLDKLGDMEATLSVDLDHALLSAFAFLHAWEVTYNYTWSELHEDLKPSWKHLNEIILRRRYIEKYFRITHGGARGGLPRGLGLWLVYYLRWSDALGDDVNNKPTEWLILMCNGIKGLTPNAQRPFDESLYLPLLACLYQSYHSHLVLRPGHERPDGKYCADEYFCSWDTEQSKLVGNAIGNLVTLTEAYVQSQIQPPSIDWLKRQMFHLSCAVGIVCGVDEYDRIHELRRHVMLPATGACGYLIDKCRVCLNLARDVDCIMIKRTLEISLMRSEQASGLRLVLN